MTADRYAGTGRRGALGAELVYAPIAAELVATCPHPLSGRTVLDAAAGTGAASKALAAQRARPIAMDLSFGMLAWSAADRQPWTGCAPGPTPGTGAPPRGWPICWPGAATWTGCAPSLTPATRMSARSWPIC